MQDLDIPYVTRRIPRQGSGTSSRPQDSVFDTVPPMGPTDEAKPAGAPPPRDWTDRGTEALAWYSPFHGAPYFWGVFIRAFGIEVISHELAAQGVDPVGAPQLAYKFLLAHELTHYRVELVMSTVEVAVQRALFVAGRRSQVARSGWGLQEEGLANARAVASLPRQHRDALDGWLATSPVGYRDWRPHTAARASLSWGAILSDLVAPAVVEWSPAPQRPDWAREVPVFVVMDGSGPGGNPAAALLGPIAVDETDSFVKDLAKSGNAGALRKAWNRTKGKLASGALAAGLHLENIGLNMYSVRVNQSYRAGLVHRGPGDWLAVMLDQQHDRLYERMRRRTR